MGQFKVGNKVRLKAKPELVGKVIEGLDPDGEFYISWENRRISSYRSPEELELVPEPFKVGDRVKYATGAVGRLVAVYGDWAWVETDGNLYPSTWNALQMGREG